MARFSAMVDMAILKDLIVSVRNLRAELKVEPKVKVPIELFVHDPRTGISIMQNWESIRRLANVDSITNVEEWRARQAPSRGTSRFDVRVAYERKIDVAAERRRMEKDLAAARKEHDQAERKLGNESFLAKAPADVVTKTRDRLDAARADIARISGRLAALPAPREDG